MYDRSLLVKAAFEFVVIADTHHTRIDPVAPTEFESRRLQADRAETALRLAASLDCDLVIHLGDLVQAYPELEGFDAEMAEATAIITKCGLRPIVVPGNHDVGDKPDPTMPTHPVSADSLTRFEQYLGPSWSSFDHHGVHFVIVNSQILNSDLPQMSAQRQWLCDDLDANIDKRVFMFLHLPPYLAHEGEPGLGHYDNIDEPDRRWLANLVRKHGIELLYAAHVHWRFFDRIGKTRYFVAPSPSFTRPGFGHLFTSGPAPEQGRDDTPKLGFLLTRGFEDRTDTHLVRTNGQTSIPPDIADGKARYLLTRHPTTLPDSPLGVTLQYPLAPVTQVPRVWPSNVRQPVRNDYPLLSCVELGVRYVRVPGTDLADVDQRRRLHMLRDEGVAVIATSLWGDDHDATAISGRWVDQIDAWEFQVPGGSPPNELIEHIRWVKSQSDTPVVLSPVIPKESVSGKQHLRTRLGYRLDELEALDQMLADGEAEVDRVLCRPDTDDHLLETFIQIGAMPRRQSIGAVDVLIELSATDERSTLHRAALAIFAARMAPASRVFIEPLIDLDRTMDISLGLLDTLCNPRPAFHAIRCLNTILHRRPVAAAIHRPDYDTDMLRRHILREDDAIFCLLVDPRQHDQQLQFIAGAVTSKCPGSYRSRIYHLAAGLVQDCEYHKLKTRLADIEPQRLLLLEIIPEQP